MAIAELGFVAIIGGLLAYLINYLARNNRTGRPLPPGPKGLPLLGNVNDLPKPGVLECHHWLEHKDKYGPISSVTVLGQSFIIINDAQIALELLRDRSAAHSARPHMVFSSDMIGWKNTLAFSGYTDTFKQHRTNIAKVAGSTTSLQVFNRVQEEESVHFLLNLLESPEKLFSHIKKEAGAVILKITYGYNAEPRDKEDYLVNMAVRTMHEFSESTIPGKWPVDIMPFLQYLPDWMPGAGFKSIARQMQAQLEQTTEQPYAFVKEQMKQNKHKTSFLSQAIQDIGSDADMERIHKWSASSMYLGGADTTVSALMTFFLAMTLFPDVQKKAQEELDSVMNGELPMSADRDRLPYIWAVVQETHRWHPVAPMALPHASTKEDMISGYRIPKGALLLPNNWWFTHDPAVYPDPMSFRPERFIETPTHKAEPDPRTWTFGYGRRVCPGRYVADNALFITIAQSLSVFKIEPLVENGKVVEPEVKFEPGVVSHPIPYRTSITPRSEAHRKIIEAAEKEYPWEKSDAETLKTMKW